MKPVVLHTARLVLGRQYLSTYPAHKNQIYLASVLYTRGPKQPAWTRPAVVATYSTLCNLPCHSDTVHNGQYNILNYTDQYVQYY